MVVAEAGVLTGWACGSSGLLSWTSSIRRSRLAYGFAQWGSKSKRDYTRSMLIELSDLPGEGWMLLGERVWRTGIFGLPSDIWRRARSVGAFTAVRSYEQSTPSRWVLIKVSPVASVQDAEDIVPTLVSLSAPNPKARVAVISEGLVTDVSVAGISNPWVYEQSTRGMPQGPTSSRYVSGNIDHVAILVACSGYLDAWPWEEVSSIAARQAAKVRSRIQSTRGEVL